MKRTIKKVVTHSFYDPLHEANKYEIVMGADYDALVSAFAEAIEDIDSWAGYASEYFQEKHDLAGTLANHRAILKAAKGES